MRVFKGILFWLVSLTWGLPLTLFGFLMTLGLLITGHKPHRFHWYIYFPVTDGWGLEGGPFFISSRQESLSLKQHEAGHGIQNLIFGPFTILFITIPSAFRFWFREMSGETKKTIYVFATTFLTSVIGIGIISWGVFFGIMWLWILGAAWSAYFLLVCCVWQAHEIPKYNKFPQPFYDSVWFEGQASNWGEKSFPE